MKKYTAIIFFFLLNMSAFFAQTSPYERDWKAIDSLDDYRLPKSALAESEKLFTRIKEVAKTASGQENAQLKTLFMLSRSLMQTERNPMDSIIPRWEAETERAKGATKAMMQSILAEIYEYHSANSYSARSLRPRIAELYAASLQSKESRSVELQNYSLLLSFSGKEASLQPFLYDLLAQRALKYHSKQPLLLKNPATMGGSAEFLAIDFEYAPALSIYQDLMRFHATENRSIFAYIDLQRLNYVRSRADFAGKDSIYIGRLENLAKEHANLDIAAYILDDIAAYWENLGNSYSAERDSSQRWSLKKSMEIIEKGIKTYAPQSVGVRRLAIRRENIKKRSFDFDMEEICASNRPILLSIDYRNTPTLHYRIVKNTDFAVKNLTANPDTLLLPHLLSQPSVQAGTWQLPDEGDYQLHTTETAINGLKNGEYMLLLSYAPDFGIKDGNAIYYAPFQVSDLAYFTSQSEKNEGFYLTHRSTGSPQKGAKANFFRETYQKASELFKAKTIRRARSDQKGFIEMPRPLPLPRWLYDEYGYVQLKFENQAGEVLMEDGGHTYSPYRKRRSKRGSRTYFFTDRAIYRPGQTVYFKGIMLQTDAKGKNPQPLARKKTKLYFYNANREKTDSLELQTNEYGSYHGSFVAPASGLTGQMYLQDQETKSSKYFRVEEYKRPTFSVEMKPVDKAYKIGERVAAKGVATAYAGNAIDGAAVRYRIHRSNRYFYWRNRNSHNYNHQEIASSYTKTNEKGEFTIEFEAKPDTSIPASTQATFVYEISVDITDVAGETHSSKQEIQVGYISTLISLELQENISREKGENIRINSLNLNGQYEAAKGKIIIERLQQPTQIYHERRWQAPDYYTLSEAEFRQKFPHLPYKNEHLPENWAVEKEVHNADFDTEKSKEIALRDIGKDWAQGTYRIRLLSSDADGNKIALERLFTLYGEEEKSSPRPSALFVAQNEHSAEVGDTVYIDFGSYNLDAHILLRIECAGKLLRDEWIQPKGRTRLPIHIKEEHRGGLSIQLATLQESRFYLQNVAISVPWSNKQLKIEYETFRDKLQPGEQEEWRIRISGSKGDAAAAEIVAAMYDASLDAFAPNSFYLYQRGENVASYSLEAVDGFGKVYVRRWFRNFSSTYQALPRYQQADIHWSGFYLNPSSYSRYYDEDLMLLDGNDGGLTYSAAITDAVSRTSGVTVLDGDNGRTISSDEVEKLATRNISSIAAQKTGKTNSSDLTSGGENEKGSDNDDFKNVKIRTNLQETVFFIPQMQTDAEGRIVLKFTMNEALTTWKFMLLAHTRQLAVGSSTRSVITQKQLMVQPLAPRFLRQGDEISFTSKVSNLSDSALSGKIALQLFDAATMQPLDAEFGNATNTLDFAIDAKRSTALAWKLRIPANYTGAIIYRIVAKAANYSDGEENSLPVISNQLLVTETLPMSVRAGQTRNFDFARMAAIRQSPSARSHTYTLEFTQNPAWYAVQALPYLMEYPYECTEQTFSRFFANALGSHIANQQPRIKAIFDKWKNADTAALKSKLYQNPELKSALLEETPWVLDAQSETEQRRNLALLFDLHRMAKESDKALKTILDRQGYEGGFSWFPNDNPDWYMTQHILEGFAQLSRIGLKSISDNDKIKYMQSRAFAYIDEQISIHHKAILERAKRDSISPDSDQLSPIAAHYLYVRSYAPEIKPKRPEIQAAMDYFSQQARNYWQNKPIYEQAMLAIALHRQAEQQTPAIILKSLRERAQNSEEMGMYWELKGGYSWYELPIETHAMLINLFHEVGKDSAAVDELKTWLLKSKQATHWRTTKATTAAIYALLSTGTNLLSENSPLIIAFSGKNFDFNSVPQEAGTGYFKKTWQAAEISPEMSKISVENPNKSVAWGAIYWQYFEDMDKITQFQSTPLKIRKTIYREQQKNGSTQLVLVDENTILQVGDLLKIELKVSSDRSMEYIHLKDMRASGFEPISVLSRRNYSGRTSYYESTRDAATHFFISFLPSGEHIFEYSLRVRHRGRFSNGITTIQSMYAPEFTAHSQGLRLFVE